MHIYTHIYLPFFYDGVYPMLARSLIYEDYHYMTSYKQINTPD